MREIWSELLSCLDLRRLPDTHREGKIPERRGSICVFESTNQHLPHGRLFGGQLLAQFVQAAAISRPEKTVKSIHANFVREGRSDLPVYYMVHSVHDGRSFSTVTVTARQHGEAIATCLVSLHTAEDGREYQPVCAPLAVPGPEHSVQVDLLPWETRSETDLDDLGTHPAEYDLWMRARDPDGALTPALIAYATDLNVIGTALRPFEGINHRGNGTDFTSASTSHTVWFHRPFTIDEWVLLRHHGVVVAHGRCFGRGEVLSDKGILVASFAQEALLRFRE
ncbi:acyl-CoA thioesterase II [Nocardia cyriacigeorgica]|uniref:Acyl-CoA thioesterase II n=1 Tax=Nocardia cyriacigeorgica TaxID=135487 RepID=A0A5R8PAF6_9NOCA|nr:acyl-CoA thioesterase domain-containing protein [Nocardia cyriacigeorgica]TLG05289.1 acyl-CoA thioesterase II [Nocardia cyriacigeorgica]